MLRRDDNQPARGLPLLLCLLEVLGIWRGLILAGRHQQAIAAEEILLLSQSDLQVVLRTAVFRPDRPRLGAAAIALVHGPRAREGMIENRDDVVQDIRIGL